LLSRGQELGPVGYGLAVRSRSLLVAIGVVVLVGLATLALRQFGPRPQVSQADMLTGADVDVVSSDLNAAFAQWRVLIDFRNPYVADVTRPGSDQPVMRCSTKTYFEASVNHKDVTAVTPLTPEGGRDLNCWTSRPGASPPTAPTASGS
jgi:hypothetical protein